MINVNNFVFNFFIQFNVFFDDNFNFFVFFISQWSMSTILFLIFLFNSTFFSITILIFLFFFTFIMININWNNKIIYFIIFEIIFDLFWFLKFIITIVDFRDVFDVIFEFLRFNNVLTFAFDDNITIFTTNDSILLVFWRFSFFFLFLKNVSLLKWRYCYNKFVFL